MNVDISSATGGFLGAFVLIAIVLPIAASFLLDGIVHILVHRDIRRILIAGAVTGAVLALYGLAWQNGIAAADFNAYRGGTVDSMDGAALIVLPFSILCATIGFAARMLDLFLNPRNRATQQAARRSAQVERQRRSLRRRLAHAAPPQQTT
jgi:biotin transporter BioY